MKKPIKEILSVTINKKDKEKLIRLVGEINMRTPSKITTVSKMVREIISNYLKTTKNLKKSKTKKTK
jgi:hypothetical protein